MPSLDVDAPRARGAGLRTVGDALRLGPGGARAPQAPPPLRRDEAPAMAWTPRSPHGFILCDKFSALAEGRRPAPGPNGLERPAGLDLTTDAWKGCTSAGWLPLPEAARGTPMFPRAPSYLDVKQGPLGNCFSLSGIAATALAASPEVAERVRLVGDHVEVRLFDAALERDVVHRMDTTVPWYRDGAGALHAAAAAPVGGAWWVAMVEKGLAMHCRDGYAGLDAGGDAVAAAWVMQALTAKPANVVARTEGLAGLDTGTLAQALSQSVAERRPVTIGFRIDTAVDPKAAELAARYNVKRHHGYHLRNYIGGSRPGGELAVLGNPWHSDNLVLPLSVLQRLGRNVAVGGRMDGH